MEIREQFHELFFSPQVPQSCVVTGSLTHLDFIKSSRLASECALSIQTSLLPKQWGSTMPSIFHAGSGIRFRSLC